MITLPVVNSSGAEVKNIEINGKLFPDKINTALLHQAVIMYLANKRQGTASTKTRGNVQGGGKKPWRQKGTGRARAGTIRSPLWRGGGVVFGPHPRDYSYLLPQKIRHKALMESINVKIKDKTIVVIDELNLEKGKTKEMASFLSNLKSGEQKVLFVLDKMDEKIRKASLNIASLRVIPTTNLNAYLVLWSEKLILTEGVLKSLAKGRS